jgi:glycosyltransferase involved in cell wall biosynthesis
MTAHDVLPREPRPGQVRAQARLWRHADAVVVHSEHGRSRLIDAVGVDPQKIEVIPHAPLDHLAQIGQPLPLPAELEDSTGPIVLSFGLIRPYKGLDLLIDAWQRVQGATLWVVGRPRMDISDLVKSAPDSVRWVTRFVDDREIPTIFNAADLCVLPYTEIDQSGVLATAMAFGKPMLLSDAGGFPEVGRAGAAEVTPAGDAHLLGEALEALIADPERRSQLGSAAAQLAAGAWSWKSSAESHLALYRRLLNAA